MDVVLLEPDTVLAREYSNALRRQHHAVRVVSSAQRAISAADQAIPDVVVLNIDLARHSGMEFLYEFKSYRDWQAVPVVLLVSQLNHDLDESDILREQLHVQTVLVRTHMTLEQLCESVADAGKTRR